MKTIIFQGDSITDSCRNKEIGNHIINGNGAGMGYANYLMSEIAFKYPKQFDMNNAGVSGDTTLEMLARYDTDFEVYKPDFMTILIGVNDIWRRYDSGAGSSDEEYYNRYVEYIEKLLKDFPNIKIYIIEPFITEGRVTTSYIGMNEAVRLLAKQTKKVAEQFNLPFIPMQENYDKLSEKYGADYWTADGVHPTLPGYRMMANEILKVMEKDLF